MKAEELKALQQKKSAALEKWEKEVLPTLDLKVMEFPARVQIQSMIEQGVPSTRICSEAACQGLTGKFIKDLLQEDLAIFKQFSDDQIISIGGRVIEVSGNPTTD